MAATISSRIKALCGQDATERGQALDRGCQMMPQFSNPLYTTYKNHYSEKTVTFQNIFKCKKKVHSKMKCDVRIIYYLLCYNPLFIIII